MGLFDRHAGLLGAYRDVRTTGADPFQMRMDRMLSPTEAIIDGRRTILLGTNNYLGLTFDPSCIDAAIEAIRARRHRHHRLAHRQRHLSPGTSSSRRDSPSSRPQARMVFTTGYQANLGVMSALAGPRRRAADRRRQPRLDLRRLQAGQAEVIRFRHNDPDDLDKRLRRLGDQPGDRLIVVEGIYRMLGDTAPLQEFAEVKREARRLPAGRRGPLDGRARRARPRPGRSGGRRGRRRLHRRHLLQEPGRDRRLLRLGPSGLRPAARRRRPYMFTASLPPSIVASVRQALKEMQEHAASCARGSGTTRRAL